MSARSLAARLILEASGLVGAAGPRLAALTARAADALSDAAHLVSPVACCPGCGAAVPALALEGVEACGACEERADFAERFGRYAAAVRERAAAVAAVNVTPYTVRTHRREDIN